MRSFQRRSLRDACKQAARQIVFFVEALCFLPGTLALASAATTNTETIMAPDFALPMVAGGTFRLSEHNGWVRVLFFVREEGEYVPNVLSMLEKIISSSPEYQKKTILLCIVVTSANREQLKKLRPLFHLNWVVLEDSDRAVHHLYKVIAVPTVVMVGPQGQVCARLAGYTLTFGAEFRAALRQCLGMPLLAEHSEASTATKRAALHLSLGNMMVKREIWSSAIQSFRDTLAIDPEMHAARLGLGFCLLRVGQTKEGVEEFQKLVVANALTTQTQVGLAWAKTLEGNPKEAEAELEKLRSVASSLPEYYEAWAAAYEAAGDKEKAKQNLDKASQLRGGRVNAPISRPNPSKIAPK